MSNQAEFDRRSGIGASMAPEIANVSPWGTPLSAYLWYVGLIPDKPQTDQMLIGSTLELAITGLAEEKLNENISKPTTRRHASHLWMYASPDGIVGGDESHGFEAKNVGPARAKDWGEQETDEVPDYVNIQCQHQAAVFGFERVTVGALICGNSFRLYTVPRNDRMIASLIQLEEVFWDRVGKRNPPEPDWNHRSTPDLFAKMYGIDESQQITLPDGLEAIAQSYETFSTIEKRAKDYKEEMKAQLIQAMGPAALAWLPDGSAIVRKKISRKAYEVKATEYFSFSIKRKDKDHDHDNRELITAALGRISQGEPAGDDGEQV